MTSQSEQMAHLQAMVRDVVDSNRFMTLGTAELDGLPRVSPVYFTHDRYRAFYWVSSPQARHSQNVARTPDVAIVIFDSSVPPGATNAVYLQAVATEVPDRELAGQCVTAFRDVRDGARAFAPDELSGSAPLRLYRAVPHEFAVHIRGSDPAYGRGVDTRLAVEMPPV